MKRIRFSAAMVLFLLVIYTPEHYPGIGGYFSVHMIGHIVLLLLCGPLLLMSVPAGTDGEGVLQRSVRGFSRRLSKHVWLAWLAGAGIMWFWHIPAIFNHVMGRMESSSILSWVNTISLLTAGMLFSWPLFGPYKEDRIPPLTGILYLAAGCISCSLMGLLITFAPAGTYHLHMEMGMPVNPWHMSAAEDQQAAGLIMWVPCCLVYLAGSLMLLKRWLGHEGVGGRKELFKTI